MAVYRTIQDYLVKAVREAKVHTEWLKPDNAYEEAFTHFAAALLAPAQEQPLPLRVSTLRAKDRSLRHVQFPRPDFAEIRGSWRGGFAIKEPSCGI